MHYDEKYMRRALQLAATSPTDTHPNPMVGAVIVDDNGIIIGEGYHRKCGQGHAEVNAIASVADKSRLRHCTMYVTLEPCSHYGKTPPCARLIIDSNIPKVVIGAVDPFEKVAGRGIKMLTDAGVQVKVEVLADECRALNRRFFTAHTLRRPYITLKWAQSADGYMDSVHDNDNKPMKFSNAVTTMMTHRLRACFDAVMTTAHTVKADNSRLNVRLCEGPNPRRVVIDRHGVLQSDAAIFDPAYSTLPTLHFAPAATAIPHTDLIACPPDISLDQVMHILYDKGITSLLVEAGPRFLKALIERNLFDSIRVETAPFALGDRGTAKAPEIPSELEVESRLDICGNTLATYLRIH